MKFNQILNILGIATIIVLAITVVYLYKNPRIEKVPVRVGPDAPITNLQTKSGETVSVKPTPDPTSSIKESGATAEFVKKLNNDLLNTINEGLDYKNKWENAIALNSVIESKLTQADMALKQAKSNELTWKNKYIESTVNLDDMTNKIKVDVPVTIGHVIPERRIRYGPPISQTIVHSDNPDFKLNGVQEYKMETKVYKPFLEAVLDASGGVGLKNTSSYNAQASFKLIINPQGKFKPYLYIQGRYDDFKDIPNFSTIKTGIRTEAGVGAQYSLFNF